jgi:hypothetical protein
MIYLIGQLWIWLLLTLLFAGLAGWAFAAERDPANIILRRGARRKMSSHEIYRVTRLIYQKRPIAAWRPWGRMGWWSGAGAAAVLSVEDCSS